MSFFTRIFGTHNDKIIRRIQPTIDKINSLEPTFQQMSDDDLRGMSAKYRERYEKGESLDSILPEAFATCREGARRTLNQRHFDVQLIGGIVLHQGKIAEMKTGEGKTLTATLPAYLRAISGKGAHVVTVNDYLAKRDAEWMAQVYNFLGLSVGSIVHGLNDNQRKESYGADITYGTNNEFGFDYLRDNMKTDPRRLVQRGHHFAIVDEVDSILIDEARTPLIISGPSDTNSDLYVKVNSAIPGLQRDMDYTIDEKSRSVSLTEDGISKVEKRLGVDNLYDVSNIEWLHHVYQALKAHIIFKKDVDYVVRNGEVIIVDEFTGRLMPGRRYSEGLHGALEAKEHVTVQQETQTLATITFQNYFRLYDTLGGMTGTADTEAVEFKKIYGLEVVVIPTNKKLVREDQEDVIYRTSREKFHAIADDIAEARSKGQPVLVGTVSVEKSELLSKLLTKKSVAHEVLNAKNHAREATIISDAGKKGHVTIATNMAGRGTDIVLGEGVREAGGLYVIGTERHESRRIDNQLRGRSGRQGDPGKSKFFLSLEDDLLRIFASDRLSGVMARLGMEEGEAIVSPMVTRAIEKAQRRVEEQNFGSRKNLLEYDDVMSQQRQVIYSRRNSALMSEGGVDFVEESTTSLVEEAVSANSPESLDSENWDFDKIKQHLLGETGVEVSIGATGPEQTNDEIVASAVDQILTDYRAKKAKIGEEDSLKIESFIYLQVIDQAWKEHLLSMDSLKDSVGLRGYSQRDPLQEYKKEAFKLFAQLIGRIEYETTTNLLKFKISQQSQESADFQEPEEEDGPSLPEGSAEEDGLIYHGGGGASSESDSKAKAAATVKRDGAKVGRNDPCPCGSGKKYKKCHGSATAAPL